jgi:hypothetical protein
MVAFSALVCGCEPWPQVSPSLCTTACYNFYFYFFKSRFKVKSLSMISYSRDYRCIIWWKVGKVPTVKIPGQVWNATLADPLSTTLGHKYLSRWIYSWGSLQHTIVLTVFLEYCPQLIVVTMVRYVRQWPSLHHQPGQTVDFGPVRSDELGMQLVLQGEAPKSEIRCRRRARLRSISRRFLGCTEDGKCLWSRSMEHGKAA